MVFEISHIKYADGSELLVMQSRCWLFGIELLILYLGDKPPPVLKDNCKIRRLAVLIEKHKLESKKPSNILLSLKKVYPWNKHQGGSPYDFIYFVGERDIEAALEYLKEGLNLMPYNNYTIIKGTESFQEFFESLSKIGWFQDTYGRHQEFDDLIFYNTKPWTNYIQKPLKKIGLEMKDDEIRVVDMEKAKDAWERKFNPFFKVHFLEKETTFSQWLDDVQSSVMMTQDFPFHVLKDGSSTYYFSSDYI
jgi:hypothetical protein